MFIGFAVGIPRKKRVDQNNINFSFQKISNLCCSFTPEYQHLEIARVCFFKSPPPPHIKNLLKKENLGTILTTVALKEPPKSYFLCGHLNLVIFNFYPVFHPPQLCPLCQSSTLEVLHQVTQLRPDSYIPVPHPFHFACYSVN